MNPEVQTSVERLARALRRLDDLVAPLRPAGRVRRRSRAEERALSQDRAPRRGRPGRRRAGGGRLRRRRWTSGRAISRRPTRSSSSTCAAPTTRTWCKLLLRKAEIVDDVAEKKTLYFRAAQLHEEVLEDLGERGRRLPARAVGRRRRQGRARSAGTALHPPGALERSQERLRQEGGAGDHARREEADAVRARSGLRPRARRSGARGRDLQLDHGPRSRGLRRRAGARSAVSAARALVRPARGARAPDRAGAVARRGGVAALTASASCGAST